MICFRHDQPIKKAEFVFVVDVGLVVGVDNCVCDCVETDGGVIG